MIEVTILVPLADNNGSSFSKDHHAAFESFILSRAGGLSRRPGKVTGKWTQDGRIYTDFLVAYVVAIQSITDGAVIGDIARFAKAHYRQEAVYVSYLGLSEII